MKKEIDSKKILNERFSQLPEVIQDIILESHWKDVIRRLTSTYNLHIDQGGSLEALTLLTMLGLEEPERYVQNLKEEAKMSESLAQEIAKDIEVNVFQKIRESVMKKTTGQEEKKVEILEEKPRDLYREEVDNIDIISKQDHEANMEKKQDRADIAANVDIIDDKKEKKEAIVDRNQLLKEIEGEDNNNDATIALTPKANTDLQKEIDGESQTIPLQPKVKRNPVHMRTLKSDIVNQKLENPSWVPKIAKKDIMSKQTKEIINNAEKDYLKKTTSANMPGGEIK